MITGNVGLNAYQVLASARIRIFAGTFGTVREAAEAYRAGRLIPAGGPAPMGFGRGMGRGMSFIPPLLTQAFREEEISILETQMEALKSQLEEVKRRLRELKGES